MSINKLIINKLYEHPDGYSYVKRLYQLGVDYIQLVKDPVTISLKFTAIATNARSPYDEPREQNLDSRCYNLLESLELMLINIDDDFDGYITLYLINSNPDSYISIGKLLKNRAKFVGEKEVLNKLTEEGIQKAIARRQSVKSAMEFSIGRKETIHIMEEGSGDLVLKVFKVQDKITTVELGKSITMEQFKKAIALI